MRKNKLREIIDSGKTSVGARVLAPWPGMFEVIANTGAIDYIEFVGEYSPWDLHDLDNIARATELYDISSMFKVDQEPNGFLAQRALGAGFQNILFTDIRTVEDAKRCIQIVKPETPLHQGINGCHMRRNVGLVLDCGTEDYVKAMDEAVIAIMVEKKGCLDNLEEILSLKKIDMVQFGPCDYSLSIGLPGQRTHPKVKEAELITIKTALKMGVRPRLEIGPINYQPKEIKKYIELGVKDFHLPSDVIIVHQWVKENAIVIRDLFSNKL
jgi:2-keto-3-deoxy-L-rhamnonate aldolase RhmA